MLRTVEERSFVFSGAGLIGFTRQFLARVSSKIMLIVLKPGIRLELNK